MTRDWILFAVASALWIAAGAWAAVATGSAIDSAKLRAIDVITRTYAIEARLDALEGKR